MEIQREAAGVFNCIFGRVKFAKSQIMCIERAPCDNGWCNCGDCKSTASDSIKLFNQSDCNQVARLSHSKKI